MLGGLLRGASDVVDHGAAAIFAGDAVFGIESGERGPDALGGFRNREVHLDFGLTAEFFERAAGGGVQERTRFCDAGLHLGGGFAGDHARGFHDADELAIGDAVGGGFKLFGGLAQNFIVKATREIEPQTRGRLDESLGQATEQFEAAADRISDRQLVRVMEATRMVTREAAAQMEARVAESRALLHTTAGSTIEEFRRQAEVQVDLAISETTERVRSALSALDAENRMACENRRRTMIDDVTRTTEQSTEQFRTGIKAFLYSCLVAAVGAVDEHAKTTLDGMVKDPNSAPRAIDDIKIIPPDDEKPN